MGRGVGATGDCAPWRSTFQLVLLAVAVLSLTAVAGKIDVPAPLLLIAAGIGASFLPFVPEVHLGQEVVLLGLLPPLLYAAALQTSLVDFNANRRAILLLSVGLVLFTAAGVGIVVHWLIPGIPWALAPGHRCGGRAARRGVGHRDRPAGSGCPAGSSRSSRASRLLNDATALVALRTRPGRHGRRR